MDLKTTCKKIFFTTTWYDFFVLSIYRRDNIRERCLEIFEAKSIMAANYLQNSAASRRHFSVLNIFFSAQELDMVSNVHGNQFLEAIQTCYFLWKRSFKDINVFDFYKYFTGWPTYVWNPMSFSCLHTSVFLAHNEIFSARKSEKVSFKLLHWMFIS